MQIDPCLILTRPERQARRFAGEMRGAGFAGPILFSPVLEIVPRAPGMAVSGVPVFTSENGVWAARALGLLASGGRAYAVGARTACAARAVGLDTVAAGGTVRDLAAFLVAAGAAEPFVHFHGAHVTGDLAGELRAAGREAVGVTVYDQVARGLGDAARGALLGRAVLLPLFSPRSARLVGEALSGPPRDARVAAMSAQVAAAWPHGGLVEVARAPDTAAMLEALGRLVARGGDG